MNNGIDKDINRYVIYLTGKEFDEFNLVQKYYESKNISFKKPSLGMHCTLSYLYSDVDEEVLINEFNKKIKFNSITTSINKIDLFDDHAVVFRLKKTSSLDNLQNMCDIIFSKYKLLNAQKEYLGENYNPHLTVCTVPAVNSVYNLPKINIITKEITLDKLVLVKKEDSWKILAKKYLLD
jgi:2'-5' RNA ligase